MVCETLTRPRWPKIKAIKAGGTNTGPRRGVGGTAEAFLSNFPFLQQFLLSLRGLQSHCAVRGVVVRWSRPPRLGEIFTFLAATNFCVTPGRALHSCGGKLDRWHWQAPQSSYNGRQQVCYCKADEALDLSETCHRMFFPGPVRAGWVAGLPTLAASLRPSLPWSRP